MGCFKDPEVKDDQLMATGRLLVAAQQTLGLQVSTDLQSKVDSGQPQDCFETDLCALMNNLDGETRAIVLDQVTGLKDWWERHQEYDAAHEQAA
jgi:hypothetical protein